MTSSLSNLGERRLATLSALVERLYPPYEQRPGATELGVVDGIVDRLGSDWGQGRDSYRAGPYAIPEESGFGWQSPLTPEQSVARGLDALDAWSIRKFGRPYGELSAAIQDRGIALLESDELLGLDDPSARAFFELVLDLVLETVCLTGRVTGSVGR